MTTAFPSPGLNGDGPEYHFTPLDTWREDIVQLAGNFNIPGAAYIDANTLELTALGANTDLLGQWNPPQSDHIALVGWHHIATTGRDTYVKIITRGWMFPFGNAAVFVQIYERVILPDPVTSNYADAYVGIKSYVRIIEPTKSFPATGQPFSNDWPFSQLTILTSVSPQLDANLVELDNVKANTNPPTGTTVQQPGTGGPTQALLLSYNGGEPVTWATVLTDLGGNELHVSVPLVFVNGSDTSHAWANEFLESNSEAWVNAYNGKLDAAARTFSGHGLPMLFAPEAPNAPGATTHPVLSFTLGASRPSADPNTTSPLNSPAPSSTTLAGVPQPAFYPVLSEVTVRLKAADALAVGSSGYNDSSGNGVAIQFYPKYVGLPPGDPPSPPLSGVYAQLTDAVNSTQQPLQFPGNMVGGLGSPTMLMSGLSSVTGPVGGALSNLSDFAQGISSVEGFFKSLTGAALSQLPQLFGALPLSSILGDFINTDGLIPNLTTTNNPDGSVTVNYNLQASLQDGTIPGFSGPTFVPNGPDNDPNSGNEQFTLTASAVISATKPPTYNVQGSITPFEVYLVSQTDFPCISIPFNSFTFTSATGSKTHVDVSLGTVSFIGALSFVNTLAQFLEDLGGSGLSISVTPTQVEASFSLSLPDIGCGMFTLSGISFGSSVVVPFLGDPALVSFNFASQDNPFTLTVCMFGGGGFFAIGLGFSGVQTIQASFEFEGQFALDLGVASGGISLSAGVYYSYTKPSGMTGGTVLTGFVKLCGEVEILGIISVSITLDLTLTYVSGPGGSYAQGTAELTLSIGIFFFSISVSVSVTKQFAGSGSSTQSMGPLDEMEPLHSGSPTPPSGYALVNQITFLDIVPDQNTWNVYCQAFAD